MTTVYSRFHASANSSPASRTIEKAHCFRNELFSVHKEAVLTNQLLRSGTSIGATLHEAQYAQGTKDFISKLEIAQKESFETEYWLELLYETGYMTEAQYKPLKNECGTIRRMLIASINTVKEKRVQDDSHKTR